MKKGFTLMELLIVIAIIGILISISAVAYSTAQKRTRDSRRRSDLKTIQNALEVYYADPANNYSYPGPSYFNIPATYLSSEPMDPKIAQCHYKAEDWTPTSYRVCADLENMRTFDCTLDASSVCSGCASDICVTNAQ